MVSSQTALLEQQCTGLAGPEDSSGAGQSCLVGTNTPHQTPSAQSGVKSQKRASHGESSLEGQEGPNQPVQENYLPPHTRIAMNKSLSEANDVVLVNRAPAPGSRKETPVSAVKIYIKEVPHAFVQPLPCAPKPTSGPVSDVVSRVHANTRFQVGDGSPPTDSTASHRDSNRRTYVPHSGRSVGTVGDQSVPLDMQLQSPRQPLSPQREDDKMSAHRNLKRPRADPQSVPTATCTAHNAATPAADKGAFPAARYGETAAVRADPTPSQGQDSTHDSWQLQLSVGPLKTGQNPVMLNAMGLIQLRNDALLERSTEGNISNALAVQDLQLKFLKVTEDFANVWRALRRDETGVDWDDLVAALIDMYLKQSEKLKQHIMRSDKDILIKFYMKQSGQFARILGSFGKLICKAMTVVTKLYKAQATQYASLTNNEGKDVRDLHMEQTAHLQELMWADDDKSILQEIRSWQTSQLKQPQT